MPINKKSRFNRVVTWLHLWLGLVCGIIVCILGITGCIYAFQQEISGVAYNKILYIGPRTENNKAHALPISLLKEKAQQVLGKDRPITYITTYPGTAERSWEFMCYQPGDDKALSLFRSIKTYRSVFINPYDGSITGQINYLREFFAIDKGIHTSLLLNPKYGEPVTGTATLLFIVLLISGLIMWYPKKWNKKGVDASFKIKWKAKWKRINYDLHNVLGFYVCIIAFIIACTGLVISFNWFRSLVYVAASASVTPPDFKTYYSDTTKNDAPQSLDIAFDKTNTLYPGAARIGLVTPLPSDNKSVITVSAYRIKDVYYNEDNLSFDQATGKLLGTQLYAKQNSGVKMITMNYDIHIGAIGGIVGKIIAFLVSLICASLPVTGVIIWLNKKKKKRKRRHKKMPAQPVAAVV